jgi:hypothetical protein
MRIGNISFPLLFLSALGFTTALAFLDTDTRVVLAPAIICLLIVFWLWMYLWQLDQQIPLFDIGVFCALATLVYSAYPLANYIVDGLQFGAFSDARLQAYQISPTELGFFHLRHVLYLFSLASVYALVRGKGPIEVGNVKSLNTSGEMWILIVFLILSVYFVVLYLTTGLNLHTSYETEAYAQYMTALSQTPLLLLQITLKLSGISFLFKLALLLIVVKKCRNEVWRAVLIVWLGAELVQVILVKGARTGFVLFVLAAVLFYHRTVKPLSYKILLSFSVAILMFFHFLGVYRAYYNINEMQDDIIRNDAGMFTTANEFQALLATAYDVYQLKESGIALPWYLYINDFITILPPQQLLSFEKVAASEWYLRAIGLSGTGVGFMWGVISQSIVGLDWTELALRGAVLGYLLAKFHQWYTRHQTRFLATLFYAFMCLRIYYTFRDTTFSIVADIFWEILPFYIFIRIVGIKEQCALSRLERYCPEKQQTSVSI